VDKRADIWAFGCVLYEMLTGRDAFAGLTPSDTLAAILERDPDLGALPATTPAVIERLLKRCFEKDPKRRLRDIGEARVEIDDAERAQALHAGSSVPTSTTTPVRSSPEPISRRWLAAALLSVVAIVAALLLVSTRGRVPAASAPGQFYVGVTPADSFGPGPTRANPIFPYPTRTDVALSPDGTLLVFSARKEGRQQLYLRALTQLEPRRSREPKTATVRSSHPTGSGSASGQESSMRGPLANSRRCAWTAVRRYRWPGSHPFVAPRGARPTSSLQPSKARAGSGECRQAAARRRR